MEMANTLKEEHPEVLDAFVQPSIGSWLQLMLSILETGAYSSEAPQLRVEIIKVSYMLLTILLGGKYPAVFIS